MWAEMDDNEHRHIARDSLFVMAELRVDGIVGEHRVRVRNLSTGGLMAEGAIQPARGQVVWIALRNLGWVEGTVAWVQDNRFGIAFRNEIDPRLTRAAAPPSPTDLLVHRPAYYSASVAEAASGQVRKI